MTVRPYTTVNVFADQAFGGNPLAVFTDAAGLSDAAMQAIAAALNLSETTFVLPPQGGPSEPGVGSSAEPAAMARVRIFTPVTELGFAGHPNVGTAFVLAAAGAITGTDVVFEEGVGPVTLRILRADDGTPVGAEVDAPHSLTIGAAPPLALVAACAGLAEEDLCTETHPPLVAGVGTDFLFAELADRATLARARPDVAAFHALLDDQADLGRHTSLHLYARDPDDPARLYTRMFGPLAGIAEDPATGSANAALAALLVSFAPGADVELAFDIMQGVEMGQPSRLFASASKTDEGAVLATVGGLCAALAHGSIDL